MADDPILDDKPSEIDISDIGTRKVDRAVLDTVIPTVNKLVAQLKHLHERVLNLENKVLEGEARDAGANPQLDLPPLSEGLTDAERDKIEASTLDVETGLDLATLEDDVLEAVNGIGPATLDSIRDTYPKIE
jgi:hypothetical protein